MNQDPHSSIVEDIDDLTQGDKVGFFARLRRYFFTGIVVTAPGVITLYVTWWFLKLVDTSVARLLPTQYNPNTYLPVYVPGVGLIITVTVLILVGWFARNYVGRIFIRASEYVVERMPVVNTMYNALKQVFETTMGSQSRAFREVVLFEYPRAGCWTLGFVTGTTKGEIQHLTDSEVVNVYVPTTPNPTSGFLLFLPKKDLIYMEMSTEDAIKLIVSGGIVAPSEKKGA